MKQLHILPIATRNQLLSQITADQELHTPMPKAAFKCDSMLPSELTRKDTKKNIAVITEYLQESKARYKDYKNKLRREKYSLATKHYKQQQKNMVILINGTC